MIVNTNSFKNTTRSPSRQNQGKYFWKSGQYAGLQDLRFTGRILVYRTAGGEFFFFSRNFKFIPAVYMFRVTKKTNTRLMLVRVTVKTPERHFQSGVYY